MHRTLLFPALLGAFAAASTSAQDPAPHFSVEVEELTASHPNAPALHSSAWAQHDGLWLFVTGRTNGMHPMVEVGDAFPDAFAHGAVAVYDPANDVLWTASLDGLDAALAEPLRVTNAQFHQSDSTFYVVGGYGTSAAAGQKTTFDTITALDVPGLIAAVQNGADLAPHLRQASHPLLAVTGGHLLPLNGRYCLIGGQFFAGEYGTASEVQAYTNAVRSFTLTDDGTTLAVTGITEILDESLLHRRDGNAAPVVYPDGHEGYAIYGGVFTAGRQPYKTPIFADDAGLAPGEFEARFGHYASPLVPLYDSSTEAMHTVFFGGMGQSYVDEATNEILDDFLIPFIDDVSVLSRAGDGAVAETVLNDARLPGLLGTNAAFVPAPDVPAYDNGVVDLRQLAGRTLVGHIHGGIEADTEHPGFFPADGSSWASRRLFAVYVTPLTTPAVEESTPSGFVVAAAPNPFREQSRLSVTLEAAQPLAVEVFDALGRRVALLHDGLLPAGAHVFTLDAAHWPSGLYLARVTGTDGRTTRRLVRLR